MAKQRRVAAKTPAAKTSPSKPAAKKAPGKTAKPAAKGDQRKRSRRAKAVATAAADRRTTAVADAVRALVVGLDGRVVELESGRDYRFGRDEACEVVALDSLVSRAHCRVRWDAERLWLLEDLGSANGTWLEGRRLEGAHALGDDEVFRIGGQEYRFRFVPPGAGDCLPAVEPPDARKRTVQDGQEPATVAADTRLAGSFERIDLPQLLCYFALSARSGRLAIDDGRVEVDLVDGVPRHARGGSVAGLQALRSLAADAPGRYVFTPGPALAGAQWTIQGSPEAVMLAVFGPADHLPPDREDLAKARAQQQLSMPDAPRVPGLEIGIGYQALCGVGGDFYDLGELSDGRVLAVLGDVSGHGVQAALVVAGLLRSLRHLAPQEHDLRRLAAGLDRDSHRDLLPGQFSTVGMAAIDLADGAVEMLLAGHHPARLLVPGRLPRPVGCTGPAIGLRGLRVDPTRLTLDRCRLERGATLVLFSDALLEARDAAGREFEDHGLDAALEVLAAADDLQQGVAGLAAACRAFAGTLDDDLSILALRPT